MLIFAIFAAIVALVCFFGTRESSRPRRSDNGNIYRPHPDAWPSSDAGYTVGLFVLVAAALIFWALGGAALFP